MSDFDFFSLTWVQLATLAATIAVFLVMPFKFKAVEKRLSGDALKAYRKISRDVYVQVAQRVLAAVLLAFASWMIRGNAAEAIALAYLGISLTAGLGSLWTVRKAHMAYESALSASAKDFRATHLTDIYQTNLLAYTEVLAATVIGALGILAVYAYSPLLPSWFWFACFLFTVVPIRAQSWSLSVHHAVGKFEQDTKHGLQR